LEYNNVSTPIDADNQSLSLTSPLDAILCKQESVRNICGERNGEAKRKIAITIIRAEGGSDGSAIGLCRFRCHLRAESNPKEKG
jgi:hypothetical protein